MTPRAMRVCVVGAGVSGLCSARHLSAAGIVPTVFERSSHTGGTWVYTETVGTDERGLPIHTSMYKSLRTNLPNQVMGFSDFAVPEDGRSGSFMRGDEMLRFLRSYADAHHLNDYIKFDHVVESVARVGDVWIVRYRNLKESKQESREFDAVMVCTGHYSVPHSPRLKGADTFTGRTLHSHDYRTADKFRDKVVLVIGGGFSGMDIVLDMATEAVRVFFSHRCQDLVSALPENVVGKPEVERLSGDTAFFVDGTSERVDVICYCTGYLYSFPFLESSCGITVEDNHVKPLYKHLVNVQHPTMCLVGMPFLVCAVPMIELQVRYFVRTLTGVFRLPDREAMRRSQIDDWETRAQVGWERKKAHQMGPRQAEYYDSLADEAGLRRLPVVFSKMHTKVGQLLKTELQTFRDYRFIVVDNENFHCE